MGAHASPAAVDEVQQLMEKGQLSAAAQRVQAQLKKDSSDVQLRFLQAVIAAEQKKIRSGHPAVYRADPGPSHAARAL